MENIDINNIENIDIKKLTLSVIGTNLKRRESMIAPAFKEEAPDDPRAMRLQNELMSAQSSDVLTLLGIYEQGKNTNAIEDMRDLISDVIKDVNNNPRTDDIPVVPDNALPLEEVRPVIENKTVNLTDYTKDE